MPDTDDSYRAGLEEIARIRSRLAELEQLVAKGPRVGLEDAVADAMIRPPVDRKTRDLQNSAHGFVPDLQSDAALAARSADPQRFDRDYRGMGGNLMTLALYAEQKAAHEALAKETK